MRFSNNPLSIKSVIMIQSCYRRLKARAQRRRFEIDKTLQESCLTDTKISFDTTDVKENGYGQLMQEFIHRITNPCLTTKEKGDEIIISIDNYLQNEKIDHEDTLNNCNGQTITERFDILDKDKILSVEQIDFRDILKKK
ncbi:hypothetical protein A3Q56_00980 [Intoshia linei]|uniref:Uncharacterized protein n=1 Tax=Intoshia linei TaxID=1819745 RepID=A0A177BAC9_9BILA|nr:hypothetical protein A3Q56_00980 [Intoshia linei]